VEVLNIETVLLIKRFLQKSELESLQRQNAQLQAASKDRRRSSVAVSKSPAASALEDQLATKTSTIESLELEVSNLRHSITTADTANLALTARVAELELSLRTSEDALSAAQTELNTLRTSAAASTTIETSETTTKPDDNETRLRLLTNDLTAAQRTATDATERATNLQKKIDTLTALHRDAETARNRELDKLRSETASLRARAKAAVDAPGSTEDDGDTDIEEDENSKAALKSKLRALEGEVFDLKRGVWREKRMEIQEAGGDPLASLDAFDPAYNYDAGYNPPMQSPGGRSVYDDIDLATPGQQGAYRGQSPSLNRTKSSGLSAFSVGNVLSAFTGTVTSPPATSQRTHARRQSSTGGGGAGGFFAAAAELVTGTQQQGDDEDDDFVFDEDAFRKAKEEEDKRRLERVREVKRGLVDWRGWRVDLVDVCSAEAVPGSVFDV